MVLGGLAVGLLNFGDKVSYDSNDIHEQELIHSGRKDLCRHVHHHRYVQIPRPQSIYSDSKSPADCIAMAVMVYALVIYQMRARAIRLRTGAPYDDRLGPVSFSRLSLDLMIYHPHYHSLS